MAIPVAHEELVDAFHAQSQQLTLLEQLMERLTKENQELKTQLADAINGKDIQHALRLQHDDALHHVRLQAERAQQDFAASLRELTTAHAATITQLHTAHSSSTARLEANITQLTGTITRLENILETRDAQMGTQLTSLIDAAVANRDQKLEIVTAESRQFALPYGGPHPALPPALPLITGHALQPMQFDRAWYNTVTADTKWKVKLTARTSRRVQVIHNDGDLWLTLRTVVPLPRPSLAETQHRQLQRRLPACRIIVEVQDPDWYFTLGLLPRTTVPLMAHKKNIDDCGGWRLYLYAAQNGKVPPTPAKGGTDIAWTPMPPAAAAATAVPVGEISTYATTTVIPPAPDGSAVELAVDYVSNTCRLAFYTADAVAAGFEENGAQPHAKLELQFNTEIRPVPADMELYPVVAVREVNTALRLV